MKADWGRLLDVLRPDPRTYQPQLDLTWRDAVAAGLLAVTAVAIAAAGMSRIDPAAYKSFDIWFQADGPRLISNMFDRWSVEQRRSHVHPIFAILTFPFGVVLTKLGLAQLQAAQLLALGCAAGTSALLYLSARGLRLPVIAAVLFTGVFLASATFIHWYAFVDTFAFAGLTIALMMFTLTAVPRSAALVWILASAGTLSITLTNWAFGLSAALFGLRLRPAIVRTVAAVAVVAVLALVQLRVFPQSRLFFDPGALRGETEFSQVDRASRGVAPWTPWDNLRSAIVTSAVVPPAVVEHAEHDMIPHWGLNNQYTPLSHTPPIGKVAVAAWLALLGLGIWGAVRHRHGRPVALAMGAYVVFQVLLHLVYGEITFLYAADFFPVMVGLAFFAWHTPARRMALALAAIFIVLGGVSNGREFSRAAIQANRLAQECVTKKVVCLYMRP